MRALIAVALLALTALPCPGGAGELPLEARVLDAKIMEIQKRLATLATARDQRAALTGELTPDQALAAADARVKAAEEKLRTAQAELDTAKAQQKKARETAGKKDF